MFRRKDIDMTQGTIWKQIVQFSVPTLIGILFQQMYNLVDTVVVGQFVGKNALAAVSCNGNIINTLVGVFMGLGTGAGVVIAQAYGSHDTLRVRRSVHTTVALTFILSVAGTVLGLILARPLLSLTNTPEEVFPDAMSYLKIYFGGLSALMIYNMGGSILRSVGDSMRPLYFLVISAVTNTVLDLLFVIAFGMGVKGVALATVAAEVLSAVLVMLSLCREETSYGFRFRELCLDRDALKQILKLGLPTAIQSGITSFSNVFVQSYINSFGAAGMAGWGAYNKLDAFTVLPLQSISLASTTFVGQNWGAGQKERAKKGVSTALRMALICTAVLAGIVLLMPRLLLSLINKESDVIEWGTYFIQVITPFYLLSCFNQIYSGALRGIGNANTPTIIMLSSFVGFRQLYLYITRLLGGGRLSIALAYPMGWCLCSALLIVFFRRSELGRKDKDIT